MHTRRPHGSQAVPLARALASRCLLGALLCVGQAVPPLAAAGELWQSVGDRRLDSMRGGFNLGGGLEVSFGITRSVYINGELITQTTLNLDRVADLSPAFAAQLQSLRLVQNGPGNTFVSAPVPAVSDPGVSAPTTSVIAGTAPGTFIQNSLDNQQILHQTIINASSNGLGLLRSVSLHDTLSDAIRQSIGQR